MDYETVPAPAFGHSLRGMGLNLLCRDVLRQAAFLQVVFGMGVHRLSKDFAIMVYAGQPFQLHSDGTFAAHPLFALLPESGPRGAGAEIRLYDTDPDVAAGRAAAEKEAVILQPPADKPGHALRETVILCPEGYAWVPSRPIHPAG